MQYRVELCSNVYVMVDVEADTRDEAAAKAVESLPKYPVAAVKADQLRGQSNPIDPDEITVATGWEVNLVQDDQGNEVWD